MGIIWHLAAKEFRLLFRDKIGLFWSFCFPVLMALFFGALYGGPGGGPRGIKVALIDEDQTDGSQKFVKVLKESPSLRVETLDLEAAQTKVRKGDLTAYLLLKKGFGNSAGFFGGGANSGVEVGMDPSRRAEEGFLQGILMQSAVQLMQERFSDPKEMDKQVDRARESIAKAKDLSPTQRNTLNDLMGNLSKWSRESPAKKEGKSFDMQPMKMEVKSIAKEESGPRSSYDITFPQGIMWGILGTITSFAIGLSVERNNGTLLRLRLAPISYSQILAGKALACFLTCMLIVTVLMSIGKFAFGVRIDNPLWLVMAIVSCGVCYTGIMMLLSTLGKTERAVNGVGWGVMMPLTMIGGGSIPVFFMPEWLQNISHISPVKWSILGMEGGIWRGFSFTEMLLPCGIQIGVGLVCFFLGVWLMRKQEG